MQTNKHCPSCNTTKLKSDFAWSDRKREIKQAYCRECKNGKMRSAYSERYSHYNERNKARIQEQSERFQAIKRQLTCIVCSESETCCIDLHHVVESTKEFGLSGSSMGFKWERIEAELKKCVPLCANCHRKVHAGLINIENFMGVLPSGKATDCLSVKADSSSVTPAIIYPDVHE